MVPARAMVFLSQKFNTETALFLSPAEIARGGCGVVRLQVPSAASTGEVAGQVSEYTETHWRPGMCVLIMSGLPLYYMGSLLCSALYAKCPFCVVLSSVRVQSVVLPYSVLSMQSG